MLLRRVASFLPLLFLAMLCMGCGISRNTPNNVVQKDSTAIHYIDSVIVRDTTIYVELPKESSSNVVLQSQLSYLTTSLAESTAYIDSVGFLCHSLINRVNRPIAVKVPVKERFVSQAVSSTSGTVITRTVTVEKQLNWWQRFKMTMFWVLLTAFITQIIIIILITIKKH